jgi:hypothetical protein
MAKGHVELNSQGYFLRSLSDEEGQRLVHRYVVPPLVQAFRLDGQQRQEQISSYSTKTFSSLRRGFGRDVIRAQQADDPEEYEYFFDSTCETRFGEIRLPILAADSTETGLEVIRSSASFKNNLWVLWEDATSTQILARKYTGSSTSWTGGGRVLTTPIHDATTSSTTNSFSHTTTTMPNRLLIVTIVGQSSTQPSAVTYSGASMSKIGSGLTVGGDNMTMWKKVAPAAGTNTVAITHAQPLNVVGATSFYNVDQSDEDETQSENTGSSTAPSVVASTSGGRLVLNALMVDGVPSTTITSGQTELMDVANTRTLSLSTKPGITASTTMSWTLGSSSAWGMISLPINGGGTGVGLDIIEDKTNLIALTATGASQQISLSTDGATWVAPTTDIYGVVGADADDTILNDVVGANEDIDAGLLATIAGEVVAALWHEENGTITFASSADAGDEWADENIDIASGNGPQGIAVYPGLNNTDVLYVGAREGLWEVDTSTSTWTSRLIFSMDPHNDNCRRMTVHNGELWFAVGVADDAPFGMWAMMVSGDTRRFREIGLIADSIPDDLLGPVQWMKSDGRFLYISVGGGASSRKARVLCHNGLGWHHMYQYGTANKEIEWIDVSADDDGTERLHFAVRTASSTSDTLILARPSLNPSTSATVTRAEDGIVDLPEIDGGMPNVAGAFLRVAMHALGTSSGTGSGDEFINVDYGVNGVARGSLSNLGDITSATSSLQFASGAGVSGNSALLRLNLFRGSTTTNTPRIRSTETRYLKQLPNRQGFVFRVDIDKTAAEFNASPETIITRLEAARDLSTLPNFRYANMTQTYVKVRDIKWYENMSSAGEPTSTAPDSTAVRIGYADVTVEEVD